MFLAQATTEDYVRAMKKKMIMKDKNSNNNNNDNHPYDEIEREKKLPRSSS